MKDKTAIFAILITIVGALFLSACEQPKPPTILYPLDKALFPKDFRSPLFSWSKGTSEGPWQLFITLPNSQKQIKTTTSQTQWRPPRSLWQYIKKATIEKKAKVTIFPKNDKSLISQITFSTSKDAVEAPIFFREVPLPVIDAMKNIPKIRWLLGDTAKDGPPQTVLENVKTCANCHTFSADGSTLAMDMDFQGDKGSFLIKKVSPIMKPQPEDMISWTSLYPNSKRKTFGLLATLSPNARFAVGTVDELVVYQLFLDKYNPQLFFPVVGHLAVYDRQTKKMSPLNGADDKDYSQTNPHFSPDGKQLLFARAKALDASKFPYPERMPSSEQKRRFVHGREKFCFDLYKMDFNEGKGGKATAVKGAANNGLSNYFPRFSPNGRFIVFCQSKGFMLNQPDATLYILDTKGKGLARKMKCNFPDAMNSWHSFSPNGKWLVFAAKSEGAFTQLWLTHIDKDGNDSVPVHLDGYVGKERAANIPEFVAMRQSDLQKIEMSAIEAATKK